MLLNLNTGLNYGLLILNYVYCNLNFMPTNNLFKLALNYSCCKGRAIHQQMQTQLTEQFNYLQVCESLWGINFRCVDG